MHNKEHIDGLIMQNYAIKKVDSKIHVYASGTAVIPGHNGRSAEAECVTMSISGRQCSLWRDEKHYLLYSETLALHAILAVDKFGTDEAAAALKRAISYVC